METVECWKICLCLFIAAFSTSRGNPTGGPSDSVVAMLSDAATSAFNFSSTVIETSNSTATEANNRNDTVPQANIGSTVTSPPISTPSLKSETSLNNSSEKPIVSMQTDAPNVSDLNQMNGMADNTSSDLEIRNETEIQVSTPVERLTSTSRPITKSVNSSVDSIVTESNGNDTQVNPTVKTTAITYQMETSAKMSSAAKDSTWEVTIKSTNMPSITSAGQKEAKDTTSNVPTAQSLTSTALPMRPTSKTMSTSMTSSGSGVISTVMVPLSTSHTRPTTTSTTSTVSITATRITTTNKATTSFSVQHLEGNLASTKKMVDGRPVSDPSETRMDPLVIGLITVFFIIIGIVSILGFLKYRRRSNQPEFRRLHELPMDDMMEEDTPLSLYSY
ncbi:poly(A) polymerase-like [Stegostoma tigrinum]|uniref:poly(A) polymerase-like n=1 Tax=Stegostoma tigrinum TaxID=3053191 RepID=UPI00202AE37D|nr:poly(A) polymerase-like [Stegostoma tigrinum]